MNERERFLAAEQKRDILAEQGGLCFVCGAAPAIFLAHRIPQTRQNLRQYGCAIIHHRRNLVGVCSNPGCNDAVLINARPADKQRLVEEIQAEISDLVFPRAG